MSRIMVKLSRDEFEALRQAAERDMRDVREEARYLIVTALANEGKTTADLACAAGEAGPEGACHGSR